MAGHIMSRREQKKKRKQQGKVRQRTSAKLNKTKVGKLNRGVKKPGDRTRAPVSSGLFSGRAFSYRKSQGGPSGRPRGRSQVWFEGNPQLPTGKDNVTVSRTYPSPRKNIGEVKAFNNCI